MAPVVPRIAAEAFRSFAPLRLDAVERGQEHEDHQGNLKVQVDQVESGDLEKPEVLLVEVKTVRLGEEVHEAGGANAGGTGGNTTGGGAGANSGGAAAGAGANVNPAVPPVREPLPPTFRPQTPLNPNAAPVAEPRVGAVLPRGQADWF